MADVSVQFSASVFEWRGPAPFYFAAIDGDAAARIKDVSAFASYGWGCIQVTAQLGSTTWTTALIPKDGRYLLPLKDKIRKAESLEVGARIRARVTVTLAQM